MSDFKYDDPHKQGFKEGFKAAEAEFKPQIERLERERDQAIAQIRLMFPDQWEARKG